LKTEKANTHLIGFFQYKPSILGFFPLFLETR